MLCQKLILCITPIAHLHFVGFVILQELSTDLKQEMAEKLMDLDVAQFSMYPVKVYFLGQGSVQTLCGSIHLSSAVVIIALTIFPSTYVLPSLSELLITDSPFWKRFLSMLIQAIVIT